jgi:hypothetical protein
VSSAVDDDDVLARSKFKSVDDCIIYYRDVDHPAYCCCCLFFRDRATTHRVVCGAVARYQIACFGFVRSSTLPGLVNYIIASSLLPTALIMLWFTPMDEAGEKKKALRGFTESPEFIYVAILQTTGLMYPLIYRQ